MGPIYAFIYSVVIWIIIYAGIFIWGSLGPITIAYLPAKETEARKPEIIRG